MDDHFRPSVFVMDSTELLLNHKRSKNAGTGF